MELSVQQGNALDGGAYTMDQQTGEITANAEYPQVNVLFHIQLDKSMADEEKAAACIAEIVKELEKSEAAEERAAEWMMFRRKSGNMNKETMWANSRVSQ